MPTKQEIKDQEAQVAADKVDSDAAEAALKEIDALAEKGETIKEDGFVKVKKSQLHKIASDRENYKKIGLQKKAEDRDLKEKIVQQDNKGGYVIDEKKLQETAEGAARKMMRESAEKTAKRQFFKDHPEYVDDKAWQELLPNLSFKGDEVTQEDVLDRMEAAVLEHKRKTGKLDEYIENEKQRARQEGRIEGQVNEGRDFGGIGDKNGSGKDVKLSPKGEEMARAMHTDSEKVKKVDLSKDNVIDIFAPKKK